MEYLVYLIMFIIGINFFTYVHESGHAYYAKKHGIQIKYFVIGKTSFTKKLSFWNKDKTIFINLLGIGGFVMADFKNLNKNTYGDIAIGAIIFELILLSIFLMFHILFDSFLSELAIHAFVKKLDYLLILVNAIRWFIIGIIFLTIGTLLVNFLIPFLLILFFPTIKWKKLHQLDGARFACAVVKEQERFSLIQDSNDYKTIENFKSTFEEKEKKEYQKFIKETYGYIIKEK